MKLFKKEEFWLSIISVLVLIYLIFRAIHVPILHDEISTLWIYVETGNFLPWTAWPDANNHFLNSFGTWIMYTLAGDEPWSLRFPNVITFIIYAISVIGISRHFNDRFMGIGFAIVMLLTHGFIEFFAFARGYGMSMAFLVFSIWMILRTFHTGRIYYSSLAFLSIVLAIMANLTLLPSSLILFLYILLMCRPLMKMNSKIQRTLFFTSALLFVLVFFIAAKHSLLLKSLDLLYYGGETTFTSAVLKTHAVMLFSSEQTLLIFAPVLLSTIAILLFIFKFYQKGFQHTFNPNLTLFPALFVGSIFVIFTMHRFMEVNFPEDRTSLFLYPFFVGLIFFTADAFRKKSIRLIVLPFIFVPIHFLTHINTSYSFHWKYEHLTEEFPMIIAQDYNNSKAECFTISGYKIHAQIWAYYVRQSDSGAPLLNPVNYPNNFDDFILLRPEESKEFPGFFESYDTLKQDPYSGVVLLKRNPSMKRTLLFKKNSITSDFSTNDEYINLIPDTILNIAGKSLVFEFETEMIPDMLPYGSVFVVTIWDSIHNSLQYHTADMDMLSSKPLGKYTYAISAINIPQNAHSMVAYVWNKKKKHLHFSKAQISVLELNE